MRLAVIGLGNVLMGDDGFGPFVIGLLDHLYEFPPEVELLDLGTPGLGLVSYLLGHDSVVFVDAAAISGLAGDVRIYDGPALEKMPAAPRVSPHDPAVAEALAVARAAGNGPREGCLVAAQPRSLQLGAGLTREMRAAADVAAEFVRRHVEDRGFAVRHRRAPVMDDDWWRRRPEPPAARLDGIPDPTGFEPPPSRT